VLASRRSSLALPLAALCLVGCLSGRTGEVRFDRATREETFDLFFDRLSESYPYFDDLDVDWEAVVAQARDLALEASSRREFFTEIAKALAALEDPHLALGLAVEELAASGEVWTTLPLELVLVERGLYVDDWGSATPPTPPDAEDSAAAPELVSIDGCPVQLGLLKSLLMGPPESPAQLLLRWSDGTLTEHVVRRLPAGDRGGWSGTASVLWDESSWISWARRGDLGVIHVATFDPDDFFATGNEAQEDIERAFAALAGVEALILDLQYNTGGQLDLMVALGDYLVAEPTPVGRIERSFLGFLRFWHEIVLRPRADGFHGPLVVLVNGRTTSAGEHLARTLQRSGRAFVVGERTPGAEAAVREIKARDGTRLVFGEYRILQGDGVSFQGRGVLPDLELPLRIEDVRALGQSKAKHAVQRARVTAALERLGSDADPRSIPSPSYTDLRVWTPSAPGHAAAD